MAGAKRNTSMSALGQFYDAIFAQTKDQTSKYGKDAKGDFVADDFSDGIATGIVEVASALAASPQLAEEFQATGVKYWNEKLTGGFGLDLTDIGIFKDLIAQKKTVTTWPTAARDEYGNIVGLDAGVEVSPEIKIKNLNDLIMDPAGVADTAADALFNNWKAAMNARALAGIGNEVQKAANYAQLRGIGVDKDVSATVAHAIVNSRIGTEKGPAGAADLRDSVLAETLAMYGGAMTEVERGELAAFVKSDIMPATLTNVNSFASGIGPNYAFNSSAKKPPAEFADLFRPQRDTVKGFSSSNRNILHEYTQNELFGPNPYGVANPNQGYGSVLKGSLQSAIGTALGDPRVTANPRLRGNLMKLFSSFDDETQATTFFSALGDAGAGGFRDMSKAVSIGIRRLGAEHAAVGNVVEASRMASAAAATNAVDGEMKLGDWLSYMSYRQKANGWFGTSSATMGMLVFGDADATKAFVDGVGALNLANIFKPNVGSAPPKINGAYFMDYLTETDGAYGLFKEFRGGNWVDMKTSSGENQSAMFSKYFFGYKNAEGDDYDKKRMMGWTQLGWVVGPNANALQKSAYMFHTYHPWQFAKGLLNGETPERMLWIGSGFGKNLHDPSKWSRAAVWASGALKNEKYKSFMRLVKKVEMILGTPGRIIKDATQKAAKVVLEKVIMKVAIKLGLEATLRAILGTLSAGVSELIFWIYTVLNWLSFGTLDKIVKGTIKMTFQFIIALIEWIIVTIIMIIVIVISAAAFLGIGFGVGTAILFAPDPGYSPVLSYGYGAGQYGGGVNIEPIINPIDWSQYEPFSDNDCPLQINGQPATVCTQGPTGTWSHAGNRGNYAIDIAGSGIGVYAPENGVASPDNISCLTTCEKLLTDSSGNYDPTKMAECKGYVQQYGQNVLGFQFHGSETGRTYRFWHVFFDDDHLNYGEEILKGTFLGAVIPGATACSTGTHVHFEILGDQHPDAAYSVMCDIPPLVCTNN